MCEVSCLSGVGSCAMLSESLVCLHLFSIRQIMSSLVISIVRYFLKFSCISVLLSWICGSLQYFPDSYHCYLLATVKFLSVFAQSFCNSLVSWWIRLLNISWVRSAVVLWIALFSNIHSLDLDMPMLSFYGYVRNINCVVVYWLAFNTFTMTQCFLNLFIDILFSFESGGTWMFIQVINITCYLFLSIPIYSCLFKHEMHVTSVTLWL